MSNSDIETDIVNCMESNQNEVKAAKTQIKKESKGAKGIAKGEKKAVIAPEKRNLRSKRNL